MISPESHLELIELCLAANRGEPLTPKKRLELIKTAAVLEVQIERENATVPVRATPNPAEPYIMTNWRGFFPQ